MKRESMLAALALTLAIGTAPTRSTAQASGPIVVRMVAAEMPERLISELESLASVEDPTRNTGAPTSHAVAPLGEDATLWVANARVDGTNTFERYYKGVFTRRTAQLEFEPGQLAPGEHVIDPGRHVFRIEKDGALSSADPDISIEGRTVTLKTYRVEIMSVDGDKAGPPETRLLGRELNVFEVLPDFKPDPKSKETGQKNMLWFFRKFCPLRVYLPANTNGQGYVLQPGGQSFHVQPGGKVVLQGAQVPAVKAEGSRILVSYQSYYAWVRTRTGLAAGFGGVQIPITDGTPARIRVGPVQGDPVFQATAAGLSSSFGLTLSGDLDRYPNKFMVAENMRESMSVRMMALESGNCTFERGTPAVVRLQYKANGGALKLGSIRNPGPLVEALRAAATNTPVAPGDPLAAQVRRVSKFLLQPVARGDAETLAQWLASPRATNTAMIAQNAPLILVHLNEILNDPVFFPSAALTNLNADAALREEAARMASLGDEALQRVNHRILDLVFPGVFAPPADGAAPRPRVEMAYSPYDPARPSSRSWTAFPAQSWEGDQLAFQTPDLPYGFYMFRVMLLGPEDSGETVSPLTAEFACCVIEPKQDGTACFISNKGRDAFVPGETIRLQAALRSRGARPAGPRTVVLKHPDGREDRLTMEDPGGKWHVRALNIPESMTRRLAPGRYELAMTDLPPGIACYPFRFDLAPPRESLFRMIKASKYTHETYAILGSQRGENPVDLDRAMATLAELGYNRFDYHTYGTDHHDRRGDIRSVIADNDERLMPSDAIYLPSARDQMLNACVRYGLEYGDVLHGAGDNQIPRYIDPYINAGERWIRREVTSMRHSPAYDGQYLYEEAYERGLVGVPKKQDNFFPSWRLMRARQVFTNTTPNQIRARGSDNVAKSKNDLSRWDPVAMEQFLTLRKWEMNGWGDFNARLASAGRELLPRARIGTYHCSFMFVQNGYGAICSAADFDNGYHPDVFANLDIASSQHYHDGPTLGHWPHAPIMVQLLRESPAGGRRLVWVNISMNTDPRSLSDGQLQRQMAFAMLAQGADGISTFHMHETFGDGPNPNTIKSKETVRWLNREVLAPFGDVYSRATRPGYLKVGIVNTLAQLSMSEFKTIRTANQLEELWVSCWRLGYPAVFLREGDLEKPLDGYQVIFVPGIRFPGELTEGALAQLRAAIKRGCRVVVERDSTLDTQIADVTKLQDFDLMNFYLGPGFNVAGFDAELDKIFTLSQACTDYLRPRMKEWGVEPAALGPFAVGPNWRDGGDIQYLLMSNYDDPDYGQTCRDMMSKPVRMPLTVPAWRGEAAYDLLAQAELPVGKTTNAQERTVVLDMTRVQGAMAAFLPEKIAALRVAARRDSTGAALRLSGALVGASGKALTGVFPVRLRLLDGKGNALYAVYRALDSRGELELDVPLTSGRDGGLSLEVVENISGKTCRIPIAPPAGQDPQLVLEDAAAPFVPYPAEIGRFLKSNTNALLVLGRGMEGSKAEVDRLIAGLGARGLNVTLLPENRVWRVASGDPRMTADPNADGFHHWHGGYGGSDGGVIEPRAVVDSPLIILSAAYGSTLLNMLIDKGFVTERPVGAGGLAAPPTLQVASRGLHWNFDTLLVVANDGEGVKRAVSRILDDPALTGKPPVTESAKKPAYDQPDTKEGRDTAARTPAVSFMGNNEYVLDMKFDAAGNVYVITWGHGDNLYSLDPKGNLRFSRRLPEMGPCRLDMDADRVVLFTSYGSRLYHVALDGKPISQTRLTLDPGVSWKGPTYRERHTADLLKHGLGSGGCGILFAELFHYAYVPGKRMVVYYEPTLKTMRALDENGNLVAEWRGEARTDEDGNVTYRGLGEFVCSPDGTRVAQFEDATLVMRDLTDTRNVRKLAECYSGVHPLSWRSGAPGPTVGRTHYNGDLDVVGEDPEDPAGTVISLGVAGGLVPDGRSFRLVKVTKEGEKEVSRMGPFPCTPTFVQVSPDGAHVVLLDEYWNAYIHEVQSGNRTGHVRLPEMGFAAAFTPDSKALMIGGLRGAVMCYDLSAKTLWSTTLGPYNQSLQAAQLPNVDTSIPDHSGKLFKTVVDEPNELDRMVTLDRSRLVNGDFEGEGGWRTGAEAEAKAVVQYVDGGVQGKRCLKVGGQMVQQSIEGLIGDHFTWVLEFFHRRATPDQPVGVLAGVAAENRHPDSVVRVLECGKEWTFARIAFKSGGDPRALRVGFQGQGGEALVDGVTLRRIRFPSVNHMLYPPLYDVEPVVLKNPLFLKEYNPLGVLREQIPNLILSQRPAQIADALVVDAFLQNGRINDISSAWHWSYLEDGNTQISMGIRNPRWVSMVAVYFNAYDAENVSPNFDVHVSDISQKKVVQVAAVRNNRSLFRLIKFPARRVDEVRLTLVNGLPVQRTVTEVEVYGPLSGGEQEGVSDQAGQNTYMGGFSRVDKRRMALAPEYVVKSVGGAERNLPPGSPPRWATPVSQVMISERNLYLSRALGLNQRYSVDAPSLDSAEETFRTGAMGFGPVLTLYGGALLKPGSDGRLYGIDPTSGRAFWSTVLGERLTGSPVAIGLDVFTATDAGKLYTLDIASGAILGETRLSGPVYGSVAADGANVYAITTAGRLHAVQAVSGKELWTAAVATNTESTPAVDGGVVYLADQKGVARAIRDGKDVWTQELGSEFSRCPVVLPELVVFGCSDGRLVALNRGTGAPVWQIQLDTRFLRYEPVPALMPPPPPPPDSTNRVAGSPAGVPEVPVLLCLSGGKPLLIEAASGKPAERQLLAGTVQNDGKFKPADGQPGIGELTAPISFYNGYLAFVPIHGDITDSPMYNDSRYHNMNNGSVVLLQPAGDRAARPASTARLIARVDPPIQVGRADSQGVTTNEWGAAALSLDGPDGIFPDTRRAKGEINKNDTHWTDFDDLGAKVFLRCDSNALYVAAVVKDDIHVNNAAGGEAIFTGDVMQVGIITPKNVHWNLGVARTPEGVVLHKAEGGTNDLARSARYAVLRVDSDKKTTYTLALPLSALGVDPGTEFGLNVVFLDDDDGKGVRYWLQLAPGLAGRDEKTPHPSKLYPRMVLEK